MGDVKDILGLNRGGGSDAAPQKKEKAKEPQRPKGLSREAFSLLYGQHPIAPSRLLNEVCKKEEPKSASTTQVRRAVTSDVEQFADPSTSQLWTRPLRTCGCLTGQLSVHSFSA